MSRYLKIYSSLVNLSLKRFAENRADFFGQVLFYTSVIAIELIFAQIVFSTTNQINGWGKYQFLVLISIYRITQIIYSVIFTSSVLRVPATVNLGGLDLILTKPLNSQFLVSVNNSQYHQFLNLIPAIGLLFYSLGQMNIDISAFSFLILSVNILLGSVIFYSIYFMTACLSFFIGKFHSFTEIYNLLNRPLGFPIDIYPKSIRIFLTFVLPLIFIVTVPTQIFLDRMPLYYVLIEIIVAIFLLKLSSIFWNFGLKHYTSASS